MGEGTDSKPKDSNTVVLAGLRIAVGLLFLIFGEYKVFGTQFTLGGGFQSWIHRFLAQGAYPCMVPILQNFVLVHGRAIAFVGGLWRVRDWSGTHFGRSGAHSKRIWADLHAGAVICVELSRCTCGILAILRCCAGSSGLGALLCRVCTWGRRSRSLITPQVGT
jgi:hypothetical protein